MAQRPWSSQRGTHCLDALQICPDETQVQVESIGPPTAGYAGKVESGAATAPEPPGGMSPVAPTPFPPIEAPLAAPSVPPVAVSWVDFEPWPPGASFGISWAPPVAAPPFPSAVPPAVPSSPRLRTWPLHATSKPNII